MTTDQIDKAAHEAIVDSGAYPSLLGFGGFPKSVSTSINECICHGIPNSRAVKVRSLFGSCPCMTVKGEGFCTNIQKNVLLWAITKS